MVRFDVLAGRASPRAGLVSSLAPPKFTTTFERFGFTPANAHTYPAASL